MIVPLVDWTLATWLGIIFFAVITIMAVWVTWIVLTAGKKKKK